MAACPSCKKEGLEVEKITVANHTKEKWWPLGDEIYSYCDTHDCDVVYFNASGRMLKRGDVKTRVTFKEKDSPRPFCYCKQVTEEDIYQGDRGGSQNL